jgi:hypothetical protein
VRPGRVVLVVVGCLLFLPGLALLVGGSALGVAAALGRDDDGYFSVALDPIETSSSAITAEGLTLGAEPGDADWLLDQLDVDVRIRVTSADSDEALFVGIAREADVDAYLAGAPHAEVVDVDGTNARLRERRGSARLGPPGAEAFWTARAEGVGTQELRWEATSGRWAAVVMHSDAIGGIEVDAEVAVRSDRVVPAALVLLALGALLSAVAVTLILVGALGGRSAAPGSPPPPPLPGRDGSPGSARGPEPVRLEAHLDPALSRWMWLVKWLLALPHVIVLAFLWIAFFVLTVVAGVAILFTGSYPRGLFDFNVGVLRWSWRVQHYASSGGIGTDRYPAFSLDAQPGDLATLEVAYPEHLSRGLVLVKWWLLAIPHYLIVGLLVGGSFSWADIEGTAIDLGTSGGLLGLLVLIAGVVLLVSGRYPPHLYDLIIGLNRWIYRVAAYAALMTDRYPPFRLDQGPTEPADPPGPPPPPPPPPRAPPPRPPRRAGRPTASPRAEPGQATATVAATNSTLNASHHTRTVHSPGARAAPSGSS